VARMKPINDRTEAIVLGLGNLTHRTQPQINITGETRNPSATKTPNITWVSMLKVQMPSEAF
jgi:hypothetical protein